MCKGRGWGRELSARVVEQRDDKEDEFFLLLIFMLCSDLFWSWNSTGNRRVLTQTVVLCITEGPPPASLYLWVSVALLECVCVCRRCGTSFPPKVRVSVALLECVCVSTLWK